MGHDGHDRRSRFDGWSGVAAVGPAHGPERHPARVRLGTAASAVDGARQPFHGLRGRTGAYRGAAEQHRDRTDDGLVCGRWPGRPGARAGDHARGECRNDPHRPGAVVQRRRCRTVLFIIGLVGFRIGARIWIKGLGRVSIGLGLMLLALHILLDTLAPAENAPEVRLLLNAITCDLLMCIVLAAALTGAAHSSAAIVLLIMSLAYSQFVTPAAALALVLGANLGSAINPVIEGGRRGDMASYRLPVGNLLNRLVGVVLVAPFLPALAGAFLAFQPHVAKMTAEFHVPFNVALALAFIGLLDPLAWLLEKIFPERKKSADPAAPRYLA